MHQKNNGTGFDKGHAELDKEVAKRRQAEEALRESEVSYRMLFENLNVGVYRTSGENGKVIRANPAMASLFGYESIEAFCRVPVSELYMDPEGRRLFLRDIREKGGVTNRELLLRRKDGTPMWASCTATVKVDANGDIQWIEGIIDDISVRKEAEAALKRSEEEYRMLFENLNVGVYRTSGENGKVIRANPAMASLFGYESIEAFRRVPVSELYMDPEDRRLFLGDIRDKGGVTNRELLLRRKDGTPMWALCTATVKVDANGDIQWIEGIIDDISGRKEAEAALKRSEEEYRMLFENLNVGVYRTSGENGKVIRANPAMASLFGYDSIEAFRKVPVSELYMDPEDRNQFLKDIKEKGSVRNRELLLRRKDGTPMWALCTATVMVDEKDEIAFIEGIIQDISKRKKAEDMLRQNNEVLNNILSASPVGIGLIVDDSFSWVNEEMLRMFGFKDKKDYSGKDTKIIYSSEDEYHRVMEEIKERFKEKRSPEVDATFIRKDGLTFTGHFRLSCPDPLNPSKRAIFTIHDISWRMKAEEERVQKEKLHGVLEMAGAVCHEMNQPMQIIINYSQLITETALGKDELSGKTKKIAEQVHRMIKITDKLKHITRYETRDYLRGVKIIDIDKSSTT